MEMECVIFSVCKRIQTAIEGVLAFTEGYQNMMNGTYSPTLNIINYQSNPPPWNRVLFNMT